ncbi:hypothetical protein MUGA111182_17875 [Mucilaginibacter galii]|uniref:Uncharacterized protein n=1 Tax=Mucilaginibacter galii TaxID=2005073 RepID=A0A917N2W0_9SPHI|nr:hypothetical protein [Mucilaginibacter galii]GGI52430.1 hypothetical protein GCM10011425_36420 [Mucilaginibacter galii]
MPLYEEAQGLPKDEGISKGVLTSLALLSAEKGIEPVDVSNKHYPYNILLAHRDAERQLTAQCDELDLFIVQDDKGRVQMAVRETLYTDMNMYYIPVLPLYRLIRSRKHGESCDLLLSVCSYLLHHARIPYYRDDDSFLAYHYEMISEWLAEEVDEEEAESWSQNQQALRSSAHFGDLMHRKIYSPYHLQHFAERMEKAKPKTAFEQGSFKIAQKAFDLWQAYPDSHLTSHAMGNLPFDNYHGEEEEDDWQENTVRLDEYVHFVAETHGNLWNNLAENINCEWNERPYLQQPCLIRHYSEDTITVMDSLDFERGLFSLITDLCTLLNCLYD